MEGGGSSGSKKPPKTVLIQPSNPAPVHLSGEISSPLAYNPQLQGNTLPLPNDGKPSIYTFFISLLGIIVSTGYVFLSANVGMGSSFDEEIACCLLCNGNALGMVGIGTYLIQRGNWESTQNHTFSKTLSYIIAALLFLVSGLFFFLWITFSGDLFY